MQNILNRGIDKFNRSKDQFLFDIGLEKIIDLPHKGGAIVCYHGVDLVENKTYNLRFISKKNLEKQFIYFKKYFNILSVADYFEGKFVSDKFNIAITFDDGYKNNFKYVLPLAEKFQIPVSIFVSGLNNAPYNYLWADMLDIVTVHSPLKYLEVDEIVFAKKNGQFINDDGTSLKQFIKDAGSWEQKEILYNRLACFRNIVKQHSLDDYWQLMSDDEIKKISQSPFITIGSHGFYHNNLGVITIEKAIAEVLESKKYLETLTQKNVDSIAFPDGSYNRLLVEKLKEINMNKQLALSYRYPEDENDKHLLNRVGIYPVYNNSYQLLHIPDMLTAK
jgi:peptidoglycan/xylan/chitin deacetylase (PgdA/CDA1 family)